MTSSNQYRILDYSMCEAKLDTHVCEKSRNWNLLEGIERAVQNSLLRLAATNSVP